MPDDGAGVKSYIAIAVPSLAIAAAALIGAVMLAMAVRRFEALERGENLLARWPVDPATWRRFAEANAVRQGQMEPRWKTNLVTIPDEIAAPIEIVVSREAVRIGEEYHELEKGLLQGIRWLPGPPVMLEFFFMIPKPRGTNFYYIIRFPAGSTAERQARDVFTYFNTPRELGQIEQALAAPGIAARRNPRKARKIAAIVAAIGAGVAIAAIAYLYAKPEIPRAWEHEDPMGDLAVAIMGIGLIAAIPALLIAFISHLRVRRSN
jgi:hypothetical protein